VSDFDSSSVSLAGSLLIAHPNLRDPNFHKSVLFISTHDAKAGALGMILNRPSGRTVGELLPNKPIGALAQLPVLLGGPVAQDQLVFASFHWLAETERMECKHHLLIPEALEALEEEHTEVRAFIGYAGWTAGQLEEELAQRSWLIGTPSSEILFEAQAPALWRNVTSTFGPKFRLIAEAPDDPGLN
jgi:putative transcriptional regulator